VSGWASLGYDTEPDGVVKEGMRDRDSGTLPSRTLTKERGWKMEEECGYCDEIISNPYGKGRCRIMQGKMRPIFFCNEEHKRNYIEMEWEQENGYKLLNTCGYCEECEIDYTDKYSHKYTCKKMKRDGISNTTSERGHCRSYK